MANGINGGLCMIYKGTFALKTDIVGQGDATITHGGAPIELNNKSSGGWRVNLDGSVSTRSTDIAIEFTVSDDASVQTLITAAFAGTAEIYTMDFIDYHYEGTFTPVISTETAAKDTATTIAVNFMSSGEIVRTAI